MGKEINGLLNSWEDLGERKPSLGKFKGSNARSVLCVKARNKGR